MSTTKLFQDPLVYPYTSEDEKIYRQDLVHYLNKTIAANYSQTELMLESNSHIVYKVIAKLNNQPTILKFFNSVVSRDEEANALRYWNKNDIAVPQIIDTSDIDIGKHFTYMTHMEYIDGENMFSQFKLGTRYLTPKYGASIARILQTLDLPYSGDTTLFRNCCYTPVQKKLLSVPKFASVLKTAFDLYKNWRLHNSPRLVHGDFRDGNMIKTTQGITILDPGPSLGHTATDFSYYLARSYIGGFTSHLNGFVQTFMKDQTDYELTKAVTLLECTRLYSSFSQESHGIQRNKLLEMMELVVDDSFFDNSNLV